MLDNIVGTSTVGKVVHTDLTDTELAVVIRTEIQKCRAATANALAAAMDAGDALIAVRPKVEERGVPWTRWLRENCYIPESTAKLYMQLARHRDEIEARTLDGVTLSLRAARKLISSEPTGDHSGDDAAPDHDNDDAALGHDDPGGSGSTSCTPPSIKSSAGSKAKKPSLVETWESTLEERQLISDLVLEQFFTTAQGADILERIPAGRHTEVVRGILDRLGVDGTRAAMSPEYGQQLRAALPKHRPNRPFNRAIVLNSAQPRGNHSRH